MWQNFLKTIMPICANLHNNLTDYLIKEEPKYCLPIYTIAIIPYCKKKKKELKDVV